jgi:fermentation-respiration switch protein FrsA (DUF1100 family)
MSRKVVVMDALMIAALVYLLMLLFLYFQQRHLMYHPDTTRPDPAAYGAAGVDIAAVTTEDGLNLQGWYFPPQDGKPVILYFHGNASHYANRAPKLLPLRENGYGLLLAEYRGYGGNPGTPTEEGFYKDARAWMKWLADKNVPLDKTFIYGESIGSGVAVQMATEYKARGLILEAPFSSLTDVAQHIYFYVPVRFLLRDQYRSIDKIRNIHMPVLVFHGDRDKTVPLVFGRKLFDSAVEPKEFITIEKAGHNDLYDYGAALHVMKFLSRLTTKE